MRINTKAIAVATGTMLLSVTSAQAGQSVSFDQLPAAARQAVEVLAPDVVAGQFRTEKTQDDNFAVAYSENGTHFVLTVNAAGKVGRIEERMVYAPLPSSARNDRIAEAASMNEDMVEFALAGETGRVEEQVVAFRKALSAIRPELDEAAYEKVAARLKDIEAHFANADMIGVSLAAVEAYKQLELALDKAALVVPIEVSLLDYSGFKLSAQSRAKSPNWSNIAASAQEASGYWKALEGKVRDKGLRDLMNSIQSGLDDGARRNDAAQVGFAAQLELDAVDLLEQYYVSAYKTGAGAVAAGSGSR